MSGFEVWLWLVALPGIREFSHGFVVLLAFCTVMCLFFASFLFMVENDPRTQESWRWANYRCKLFKISIVMACLAVFFSFVRIAVPNEKQIAAIILIPAITQSERVQDLGDKTLDLLNKRLDQWLEDVAPENMSVDPVGKGKSI